MMRVAGPGSPPAAIQPDDLAGPGIDSHVDVLAVEVAALDLPDAFVEPDVVERGETVLSGDRLRFGGRDKGQVWLSRCARGRGQKREQDSSREGSTHDTTPSARLHAHILPPEMGPRNGAHNLCCRNARADGAGDGITRVGVTQV